MGIYSNMLVFESSNKAKEIAAQLGPQEPVNIRFDMRAQYPLYKVPVGYSLAFNLAEFKERNLRAAVSAYNKRNDCMFVCVKHDEVLEVARIK